MPAMASARIGSPRNRRRSRTVSPHQRAAATGATGYLGARRTSLIQRSTSRFFSLPAQIAS